MRIKSEAAAALSRPSHACLCCVTEDDVSGQAPPGRSRSVVPGRKVAVFAEVVVEHGNMAVAAMLLLRCASASAIWCTAATGHNQNSSSLQLHESWYSVLTTLSKPTLSPFFTHYYNQRRWPRCGSPPLHWPPWRRDIGLLTTLKKKGSTICNGCMHMMGFTLAAEHACMPLCRAPTPIHWWGDQLLMMLFRRGEERGGGEGRGGEGRLWIPRLTEMQQQWGWGHPTILGVLAWIGLEPR